MPGGVFKESATNGMSHFVIVSERNYFTMISFARAQAKLTIENKLTYRFTENNCADFVYQVFQHSDLPQKYRRIVSYLKDKDEPVAIYAEDVAPAYEDSNKDKSYERGKSKLKMLQQLQGLPEF